MNNAARLPLGVNGPQLFVLRKSAGIAFRRVTDRILVFACLLGSPVRYNSYDRLVEHRLIALWLEQGRFVQLCPELAAGFETPRPPAEIEPGRRGEDVLAGTARIFEDTGEDVTDQFLLGRRSRWRRRCRKGAGLRF